MAAIDIQLLGHFSVRRSGEEIPPGTFGGRLVRALIRLLVTRRGSFVPRDVLAEALWSERMPSDPAANLRVLVQRARAALGDASLIRTGEGGYSFTAGDSCTVDAERFLVTVQAGSDHMVAGHAAAASRAFRSALEGWAGEPLAEDAYEDWAQEPRAALQRAYLSALEGGAEAALALRDPGQAVALAERAVTREPLREPAALLLARGLAASGDQVAALRTIDSLRRRLAEQVGLDPSPEALALETSLQRGEPPVGKSRRPSVATPPPAFDGLTFVGRDEELEATLAAVSGPEPGVVLVAGAAGTGKTRLLAEVATRSEMAVLVVRAFLPERDEPWSLAGALLREALDLDLEVAQAIPDRAAQALADVLPELEQLRPISRVTIDPESRRALALEAAVRVRTAASTESALVVVDDFQWTDPTSLAVLGLIARRVPRAGLALAYRPEEVTLEAPARAFLDELRPARGTVVKIPMGPLTPENIHLLVADEAVATALAEETDRTPLAITEAIRGLSAEGVLEPDTRGGWLSRRSDSAHRAREVARSGQRRAIAIRTERQPHLRRRLLSLLALLGREVPARVVARAADVSEATILDGLDALARAGLARLGDAGWSSAHALIGEVVVDGLDRTERGGLHQLLARALEAEGGDPAEVARHLAGAGDREAAAAAFSEAARRRLVAFAGEEARQLADAGLGLDPEPAIQSALMRTRAEARVLRGDLAGGRDDLREVLPSVPRGPERSRVLARVAELTSALEGYDQAGELIEVALAEAAGDEAARAEALTLAAFIDVNRDQPLRAEARAAEALALFEDLGEPGGVAAVVDLRALVQFHQGRLVEANALFDRAARLYRDSGRLLKVGTARVMRAWALLMNDRAQEALGEVEGALELERALGQTEGEAGCLVARSEVLSARGRLDEARCDVRVGLALSRALGNREWISMALSAVAVCRQVDGDLDGAEAALREAVEVGAGMSLQSQINLARLALVLLEQGDLAGAEQYAAQGREAAFGVARYESLLVLAEVALARGDPDGERLAREAVSLAEAGGYLSSRLHRRLAARVPSGRGSAAPDPPRRRKRATFVFTDIVASTNLVEVLGDEAWGHLLHWHDEALRSVFAEHGGEVVKHTGDGFFVAFEHPASAVEAAVAIQWTLATHRRQHGFAPRVRVGIHEAEATRTGPDYAGKGVHEAARIGALADGDEILASRSTVGHLRRFRTSKPRTVTLRGIKDPVEIVTVNWR